MNPVRFKPFHPNGVYFGKPQTLQDGRPTINSLRGIRHMQVVVGEETLFLVGEKDIKQYNHLLAKDPARAAEYAAQKAKRLVKP